MELDKTTDTPLISVIMGIYNCADTLPKAVECITNQSYRNWELIMCDDCSKDSTLKVAKFLEKKDSRIKVIHNNENMTLAPTLNRCLAIAKGTYIARMDGDDTCSPERLEKEVVFLESHPEYAIVSCSMSLSNEEGIFRIIEHKEQPEIRDFIYRNQHCHAGCMIRTDAIRTVHGYSESAKYKRVEDYDLWIRMYKSGYRGYNLKEVLYDMFDSEKALKRRSLSNRLNESRVIFEACQASKVSSFHYFRVAIPIVKWFVPTGVYRIQHIKNKQKG